MLPVVSGKDAVKVFEKINKNPGVIRWQKRSKGKFAGSNYPENANVSDMAFEDYQGYVMNIVDYMHLIQVEQLSKGIPAILSIDKKQDKMLEKQDETIAEIKQVSIKIDQGKEEIVSEIKSLRDDFRSRFDSRLERIEIDLAEIKVKVGIS
ncbi:MAG: hypothetical protein SCH70_06350 [Candidatus Methanoperedens sp.]|nr:hypothetical protein [Candidatus Methanoperedens sp.]